MDRAAPHVVGGYLIDKPRDQLYLFAASDAPMERRTAIVATMPRTALCYAIEKLSPDTRARYLARRNAT